MTSVREGLLVICKQGRRHGGQSASQMCGVRGVASVYPEATHHIGERAQVDADKVRVAVYLHTKPSSAAETTPTSGAAQNLRSGRSFQPGGDKKFR